MRLPKSGFYEKNLVFRQGPWFGFHKRFERYQLPEKMPALRLFHSVSFAEKYTSGNCTLQARKPLRPSGPESKIVTAL